MKAEFEIWAIMVWVISPGTHLLSWDLPKMRFWLLYFLLWLQACRMQSWNCNGVSLRLNGKRVWRCPWSAPWILEYSSNLIITTEELWSRNINMLCVVAGMVPSKVVYSFLMVSLPTSCSVKMGRWRLETLVWSLLRMTTMLRTWSRGRCTKEPRLTWLLSR